MPLGLRLPSGVRGDWGLDSVPDEVDDSSLATTISSQPPSVSPKVDRMERYVNDSEGTLGTPPLYQSYPSVGVQNTLPSVTSRIELPTEVPGA